MAILAVQNVTMRFGGLVAVNQVDLQVEPGQIYSVIGPNGAGKTTLFNTITGIYAPTEGHVLFDGHRVRKPLQFKTLLSFLGIGLIVALLAVLAVLDIDGLWKATIKRQSKYVTAEKPFSYAKAWEDALAYARGELALEENSRTKQWQVLTTDDKELLDRPVETEAEARKVREALETGQFDIQKDGDDFVALTKGEPPLELFFGTQAAMDNWQETIQEVLRDRDARPMKLLYGALGGFFLGTAGSYVIWNRNRRTADVIARSGIARTFQNIRLFQKMTVLENVLIGLDRSLPGNAFTYGLLPRFLRKSETRAKQKAMQWLKFVGIEKRCDELAKNLPYGDQRRLEIARALACEPKLLLLDEPAAGMNPSETVDLMKLIRRIREQKITVLLIEHHMNLVMGISDQIAVLNFGSKIAEGTPEEVKNNPKVIEAYLGEEEVT